MVRPGAYNAQDLQIMISSTGVSHGLVRCTHAAPSGVNFLIRAAEIITADGVVPAN
jgi:hypothetical protein